MNESAPYVNAVHAMYEGHCADNPHIPSWLITDQRYRNSYVFAGLPPRQPLPRRWYRAGAVSARHRRRAGRSGGHRPGRPGQDGGQVQRVRSAGGTRTSAAATRPTTATTATRSAGPTRTWRHSTRRRSMPSRSCPGDLGTKGGLRTDERARVLREDGTAIAGLYAAGNTSAAVMGRGYPGAGATIGPAMTFGYLAALDLADARRSLISRRGRCACSCRVAGSSPIPGTVASGPFIYHGQATLAPICLTGPAATAKFPPCITTPLS